MSTWNPNSGWGQGLMNMISSRVPTFGNVHVVFNEANSDEKNYFHLQDVADADADGNIRFYTDLKTAYDACESNNNDVILLDANSSHAVSVMLTVAKNRIHFMGMDGGGRLGAQGAKVSMGVTGVATDVATILNTGTRNTFRNLKIMNNSTTDESLYAMIDGGEGTVIENCNITKLAGLDDANWSNFIMAGDSCTYRNCVFGSSNVQGGAVGFGILIDTYAGGAAKVKNNWMVDCFVEMQIATAEAATSFLIKIAAAGDMNFNNHMKNCVFSNFVNVSNGGVIMTDATDGAAGAQNSGSLLLTNPTFFGATGVGAGANTGIRIAAAGLAPDANGGLQTDLTD